VNGYKQRNAYCLSERSTLLSFQCRGKCYSSLESVTFKPRDLKHVESMSQKLNTVFITIGLGILFLLNCAYEGEQQKAEASSSSDIRYQKKLRDKKLKSIAEPKFVVNKLQVKQNSLGEVLAPNPQIELLVTQDFKFTEGPIWNPDGFLLFSDIPANTIYKWQPKQKISVFRQPSGNANGNTLDRSGRLISAEHGNRRISRTEKDGKIVTLASHYQGKRLNSPNDLVVKSDGSIYFTDPPFGIKSQQEELGFYGVYRLAPDGTLNLLVKDFVRPNGIVFSPDETKLYVNDSEKGHIRVFDIKPDGMVENGKLFAELKPSRQEGSADGMKVDIKGNVYSTGPGGIWIFAPNGTRLGIIEIPQVPANLAWGDHDYKTLYITARDSLYRIRLKISGVR
jgi:sugar lactone lactonase YvrE